MPRLFVARDFRIDHLDDNLREVKRAYDAVIPGLEGPTTGMLWEDAVRSHLEVASRVLVILRDPNANAAFELGYAIGQGKPWAIAVPARTIPGWLKAAPLQGAMVQGPAESIKALRTLLDTTWAPGVPAPVYGTAAAVLHVDCHTAEIYTERVDDALPQLWPMKLPPSPLELGRSLDGVGELAWIIPPRSDDDVRHGEALAATAIVAGYALGTGRRLSVWAHARAQEVVDVAHVTRPYASADELVDGLRGWLKTRPGALAAWKEHLRRVHSRLVPFFEGAADRTLDDVFVQVEVSDRRGPSEALRIDELVDRFRRSVILGEPGAGKTTLMRHFTWRLAGEDGPVPVFISLGRLRDGALLPAAIAEHESGIKGLAAELEAIEAADDAAWERWRGAGDPPRSRLIVLLDGLDEVGREYTEAVRDRIADYVERHPGVRVLLTGRHVAEDMGAIPAAFGDRAVVQRLQPDRQKELLRRLLGDSAAPLVAQLERGAAWGQFASNPLLLTLVAMVARETGARQDTMPTRRTELYGWAVRLLLSRGFGIEKRGVKDPDLARDLLGRLSVRLQEEGGEQWAKATLGERLWSIRTADAELGARVAQTWESQHRLLEDIGANSGVLGPHDGASADWRFLHRSLREFLAAERLLVEGEGRIDAWTEAWASAEGDDAARWGEVHALLCGLAREPMPLLSRLRDQSPELARRAVLSADIDGVDAAKFLMDTDGWEEEELLTIARASGPNALLALVQPDLDLRTLAALWYVVETSPPEFFARAGRALGTPPPTVRIDPGEFAMGSPEGAGNADEHPAHLVRLTRGFRLGLTPVTEDEWARFTGERNRRGSRLPAVGMTWYEARLFAAWVGGDLPTEAEWEYACRARSTGRWCFGDDETRLADYAWYGGAERQPVGKKRPNAWGLHDMHGNVWEWCRDDEREYTRAVAVDPVGCGGRRMNRGGAYLSTAFWCRSAHRGRWHPGDRFDSQGFRVRLPLP